MRKLNVTFIIGSLRVGGTQKHIFDLIRCLDRDQFSPSVIVLQSGGFYFDRLKELQVPIRSLDLSAATDTFLRFPAFRKLIREFKPDILHLFLFHSSFFGCLIRLFTRNVPIILSKRSLELNMNFRRYVIYKALLMKIPDAITAVSEPVRKRCLELGATPEKTQVIRNGIEWTSRAPKGRLFQRLGIPAHCRIIGTVGSLTSRKRHQVLLEVAPHLLRKFPDLRFVILGEGGQRPKLQSEARRLGIESALYLPGTFSPATDYLPDFSLFVLTSSEEGTSNALLEAMMLGVPCVVSDIPSNRELIESGMNGLLIDPNDTPNSVSAIERLLTDDNFASRISARAQEDIKQKYRLDRMVKENQALYLKLAVSQKKIDPSRSLFASDQMSRYEIRDC